MHLRFLSEIQCAKYEALVEKGVDYILVVLELFQHIQTKLVSGLIKECELPPTYLLEGDTGIFYVLESTPVLSPSSYLIVHPSGLGRAYVYEDPREFERV